MKKRYIVFPIVVIVLAAGAFLVWRSSQSTHGITVVLDTVAPAYLTKEVIATGEIASDSSTTVSTGVSGRIAGILVDEGDQVRTGDVVAVLEEDTIRLRERSALLTLESARQQVLRELMSLRSSYADAEAAVEEARTTYDRTAELQQIGSATSDSLRQAEQAVTSAQRALDRAREQLNFREGRPLDDFRTDDAPPDDEIVAASIEVRQAEASLESIRRELSDTRIAARHAGTVTDLFVETGDLVSAGTGIARLDEMSRLVVVSAIDEVDIGYLAIGQPVRIESDSFVGTTLTGSVSEIGQIIRRQGDMRVCDVEVSLDDPEGVARVGASCAIYVTVREVEDAPSVPIESFFLEDGKKYVYVATVKADVESAEGLNIYELRKREVEIGILGLGRAEVVTGVEIGELVVASGARQLADGQVVTAAAPEAVTVETPPGAAGTDD